MKPHVVIVGTGLGGCYLAAGLVEYFDVTMVELTGEQPLLRDRLTDLANPAVTYPTIESGFGGSTKVWHNALMEIEASIFEKRWPFPKDALEPFYVQAFQALSGTTRGEINKSADELRNKFEKMGFSRSLLSQAMFIPKVRVNAWETLGLKDKVKSVEGEVSELVQDDTGRIIKIKLRKSGGVCEFVYADYFVLAAGGLGSPLLLQKLATVANLLGLRHAGLHYEDHPVAFVGEVELDKPLYKLWDFPVRTKAGNANIRIPLSFTHKNLNVSFQLRPAHHLRLSKPREKIISVINDLRNFPYNPKNYWRLLTQMDDLVDILSFKFGLRIPTKNYSILMISEQPPSPHCAVWKFDESTTIYRRWEIDALFIDDLKETIKELLRVIEPLTKKVTVFERWPEAIYSSSHHSGTARLSNSHDDGVCDINGRVHGVSNLFVCDGSLIPASGFVNTGLTIVALAMRMADYFSRFKTINRDAQ